MGAEQPMINAQHLHKSFGSHAALADVSLSVARGEALVVIGPSGSGKTTLLRVLCNLEKLDAGTISVDGTLLGTGRWPPQVRREIGMVFQQFNLFPHMSVLANIVVPQQTVNKTAKYDARERAMDLLRKIGLSEKAQAYPHELSGGQQQRVAIARSLAMNPKVMLFDEVTSALDRETVMDVLTLMRSLSETGMTMLVVTHELWFARNVADRILLMDHGVVIEEGVPDRFFNQPTHERTREFLRELV
jgi:ABC-type polar amino acid transport system ATPase subunit